MITARPRSMAPAPAPAAGDPEAPLVRRAARGDDRAFETLFRRYREPLSRYCRAMLGHEQDAEDAFQQAMIRVHGALGSRGPDGPLRPWLFRVAHNECVRVAGRRRPVAALPEGQPAPGAGPPERAEQREAISQLRDDLLALPDPQRAALVMRELSGLSHRQIASALQASPEAAKQLIHQARCSLGEFDAGRSVACADVRRRLSDRDGRVLRARAVASHLRSCEGCRAFRAEIAARPARLAALVPPLPALAAERVLSVLAGGAGAGAGAGGLGGSGLLGGIGAVGAVVATSAALVVTGVVPGIPADADAGSGPPAPAAAAPSSAQPPSSATADPAPARTPSRAPARDGDAATPPPAPAADEAAPGPAAAAAPAPDPALPASPAPDPAPARPSAERPAAGAGDAATPAAPVTASAAVTAGSAGVGADVEAGASLPAAGTGATARVSAAVTPEAGVEAGVQAQATTPLTPSVDASVDASLAPRGVEVTVTPPLGLPPLRVRTPGGG